MQTPGSREKVRAEKEKRKSQRSNKRKNQKGGKKNREGRKMLGGGGREAQGILCFFKMEEGYEAKMPAAPRKEKKARNKISKRFQKGYSSVDPSRLRAPQNYKRISFYYFKLTCVQLLKC